MMVHLAEANGRGGFVAVCGAASWESLTKQLSSNECWECSAIVGTEEDEDSWRLGLRLA